MKWFADLGIGRKLGLAFTLFLSRTSVLGGVAIRRMSDLNQHTVKIGTEWLPSVSTIGDSRTATMQYRMTLRDHIIAGSDSARTRREQQLAAFSDTVDSS